jgi:hypothetical protein
MMAEILGKSGGYAGGRSGTLHLSVAELARRQPRHWWAGIALPAAPRWRARLGNSGEFSATPAWKGAFYEAMILASVWCRYCSCAKQCIPAPQRRQFTSSTLPAKQLADVPQSLELSEIVDGADADALAECFIRLRPKCAAARGRFIEVHPLAELSAVSRLPNGSGRWPGRSARNPSARTWRWPSRVIRCCCALQGGRRGTLDRSRSKHRRALREEWQCRALL